MKTRTKKKAKGKTTALAKRNGTPPARRRAGGAPDMLARAGAKKGLDITTSGLYFQPLLPEHRVLWNIQRDRDGNVIKSKPYAPYELLIDNTHRRGVLAVDPEELPTRKCTEAGCYNPDEKDVQHRFKAVITLETGQRFTGHGEACKHNTTRITRSACPRMAETRAKARAMRDATNIGMACVVELPDYARGEWREGAGGAELSQRDVEERVDRAVRRPDQGGGRPALPPPSEPQPPKDDKQKAMAALHAVAKEKGVNAIGLHGWIHRKENVASISELNALKLQSWANELRKLAGDDLEAFKKNCLAIATGGEVTK